MATYAVTTPPDDPFNSPHRRLVAIAEQISGMLNAGEMDDLPLGTRGALAALPETLMDIAGRITPGRSGIAQSGTLADIVAPLRGANIGHDLSQAWIETRAMRLGLSTAEQVIAVMAFLDRMIQLSFDDGH